MPGEPQRGNKSRERPPARPRAQEVRARGHPAGPGLASLLHGGPVSRSVTGATQPAAQAGASELPSSAPCTRGRGTCHKPERGWV